MFDYHMHSRVSFDGHDTGLALAQAAQAAGLQEICFTDHVDYDPLGHMPNMAFDTAAYSAEYDGLSLPGLKIRRGMEFGLLPDNLEQFRQDLQRRPFDFVLEQTLACLQVHDQFDVLAHLTYIAKTSAHPAPRPVPYDQHREIVDEILRILVQKGKGLEMNTSGVDRCGGFLPTADYFRRFRELGGEIVTVGTDSHRCDRVGQYAREACDILKDIFGYVCTFENRQPIFHKV